MGISKGFNLFYQKTLKLFYELPLKITERELDAIQIVPYLKTN